MGPALERDVAILGGGERRGITWPPWVSLPSLSSFSVSVFWDVWHVGCAKCMIDFTNSPLMSASSNLKWETFAPLCISSWTHCPLLSNSTHISFGTDLDYDHKPSQSLTAVDLESLERALLLSSCLPHLCSILQPAPILSAIPHPMMPGCYAWEMDISRFLSHSSLSIPEPTAIPVHLSPQHFWLEP